MRLQQLALRVSGYEQRLRFHDRLTVIAGIGREDRQGLVEVLLGTLAGAPTISSELAYVDASGRLVKVDQTAEGAFHTSHDDGTPGTAPSAVLGLTVQELFRLTYVGPEDLGLDARHGPAEPKELSEARAALTALTDQLHAAQVAKDAVEALRLELVTVEEELRQVELGRGRRRYARLLLQLEQVKAEKAALAASVAEAEMDRRVVAQAAQVRPLAQRWREAAQQLMQERRRFGTRPRLDAQALAGALAVPDRVPPNLDSLVAVLAAAEAQRERLSARLAGMMASHLPVPSHPEVARLARADQDRVWAAAYRALETSLRLEKESLAVGGLAANGVAPKVAQEIESAHNAVEQAREALEKRRFGAAAAGGAAVLGAVALPLAPMVAPLALAGAASAAYWAVVSPRQLLAEAQGWEEEALVRAGVPTYLAFHLRRVQALHDPSMRANLDRAAQDHRQAMAEWRRMAGDLSPAEALELEDEVRAYSASVAGLEGLSEEVLDVRRRLIETVEPAVERAREALMEVCRPFGIESPTLAADLVRQLAGVAHVARLQQALEAAEAAEQAARRELDECLTDLGSAGGDLAARLADFEERATSAEHRMRFRAQARSLHEIDREITHLVQLSHSEYRPEYGHAFTPADAVEPDPEVLRERRNMKAMAYATASRLVPDISRIADRRNAVQRRVDILERQHGERDRIDDVKPADIEAHLQERLAGVIERGAGAEALPLMLDDCFRNLRPDAKWAMLDVIDRLSGRGQIVYLTDDSETVTWGRRRAAAGTVGFVDPIGQSTL